jgi:hypothetical protein
MPTVPLLGAVVIGVAVISGCGQQHAGGVAASSGPGPSSSASSGGPTSGGPSSGGPSSGGPTGAPGSGGGATCHGSPAARAHSLTITAAGNYKTFCVTKGTKISVFLKGTPDRKWAPIHASSGVLRPAANGELALAMGVTGASFLAAEPGTATITSARPVCAKGVPPANGTPGALACDAILAFRVIVRVTG